MKGIPWSFAVKHLWWSQVAGWTVIAWKIIFLLPWAWFCCCAVLCMSVSTPVCVSRTMLAQEPVIEIYRFVRLH